MKNAGSMIFLFKTPWFHSVGKMCSPWHKRKRRVIVVILTKDGCTCIRKFSSTPALQNLSAYKLLQIVTVLYGAFHFQLYMEINNDPIVSSDFILFNV